MLKFSLKSREQVEDFVRGVTFYGTGGGGSVFDYISHRQKNEMRWVYEMGYSAAARSAGVV